MDHIVRKRELQKLEREEVSRRYDMRRARLLGKETGSPKQSSVVNVPNRKGHRRRGGVGFDGGESHKRKLLMKEIEKLANPESKCKHANLDGLDADSMGGDFGAPIDLKKATTTKKSRKDQLRYSIALQHGMSHQFHQEMSHFDDPVDPGDHSEEHLKRQIKKMKNDLSKDEMERYKALKEQ